MRIAALKAQKKAEMVTIRLTVWIYPEGHTKATKARFYELGSVVYAYIPRQASFSTIQEAVRGHENADSILDTLINRAADAYRRCPAYKDDDLDLEALFLRSALPSMLDDDIELISIVGITSTFPCNSRSQATPHSMTMSSIARCPSS
jgi:hypothetical protein